MTNDDLQRILSKPGYGISSPFTKRAIPSAFKPKLIDSEANGEGKDGNVESTSLLESLQAKRVSFNYTGKVRISVAFYRRRLADYSRAISEKALVDCFVYAGLITGDSEREIWLHDLGQFKVETDEEERTEFTLEYSDVDLDEPWIKNQRKGNDGR